MNSRSESKSIRDRRLVGVSIVLASSALIWWGVVELVSWLVSGRWKDSWLVKALEPYETLIIVMLVAILAATAMVLWVLYTIHRDFKDLEAIGEKMKRKYHQK